jgi:hypothetical protein
MISLKNSGDTIAGEFSKLISNLQTLKKQAGDYTEDEAFDHHDSVGAAADDAVGAAADDSVGATADDSVDAAADDAINAADFLVDQVDLGDDHAAAAIDGAINTIESVASPSGSYIMNGLGKIAAGLRLKGEGFAADMVEATAISIGQDLNKEAEEKNGVITGLRALAAEFDAEKDTFAGDMVRATISNIINE